VYGLVALGFALIYKATGVMNFAQGELMMLGAYLHYSLVSAAGLSPLAAVPLAVLLAGLFGAALERGLLHPLVDEPPLAQVMATIGLATVLRAGTGMIWSHDTFAAPSPIPEGTMSLGSAVLPLVEVWTVLVTAALSGLLFLFFHRTDLGVAMRAVAQNRYAAQLVGIRAGRLFTLTWALAAAIAAVGGILLGSMAYLHTGMGLIALRAFPAVVLGGLESIPGAVLGGLVVGLAESLSGAYLDPVLGSGTREVVPFVILLAALLVRPTGFFGASLDKRV
jgi:branched-chain amino acid transport system permease protein